MSSNSAQCMGQSSAETGTQRIATDPKVEIPPVPVVSQPTISSEEQNILGRILRLALLRFYGAPREDSRKFLTTYEDRLYGLGF